MEKYRNRQEAGRELAALLSTYAKRKDVLVFALPRGGVPVAFEIAQALQVPLDVFIVRKLGVPTHEELAMGAMALGGEPVFNQRIVQELNISAEQIASVIAKEKKELQRRDLAYRGNQPFPEVKNKLIILVDDGMATGATMRAAINALRAMQVAKIIVAVPVADKQLCEQMQPLVDELICPLRPEHFYAVGAWYEDFSQTEDAEVFALLKK